MHYERYCGFHNCWQWKERSETVGNRSETVYSGRKLSETVGKTVGKGRKRSEKVWKSLNLDSILSEKSGNNPETIQKKSGKNPVLEFSHILLFQVFLGPFPDLSRFFPGFIQKNRKRLEKLSEKVGKTVGKGRKKSEKVGKGQKTSEKVGFFFRTETLPTIMESAISKV